MDSTTGKRTLGIMAYGSLINNPGDEIAKHIVDRIACQTPFKVEYARLSRTRDNAPTLIPVTGGTPVNAMILVLDDETSIEQATSMLWRRERNKVGSGEQYNRSDEKNRDAVTIERIDGFQGVETILYTKIPSNMGILNTPPLLANFAIKSILNKAGAEGRDGIRYLKDNIDNGVLTQLTAAYRDHILQQTGTTSLGEAITKLDAMRPRYLKDKQEWADFEVQIRDITDLIHEYGIKTTFTTDFEQYDQLKQAITERKEDFIGNVHKGFKMGQEKALNLILQIQDEREANNAALKAARKQKDKGAQTKINGNMKALDVKENILRHLMDSIVWQLIKGQTYISRRLYNGVGGEKKLRDTNFESVRFVAAEINKKPTDFALITDLTGYVQAGDLLCLIDGKLTIQEVKEGTRNHQILEMLGEMTKEEMTPEQLYKKYHFSKDDLDQLERQFKQMMVLQNIADVVNKDEGIDNSTGRPISIITPEEPTPRYTDRLIRLREELDKNNMLAYDYIDNCLHIGLFKGDFRDQGRTVLKALAQVESEKYILMDIRMVFESLYKPIFTLPFAKEFIFDLMFGRVFLLFLIDIEKYMALAEEFQLSARWATRKEMGRVKAMTKKGDIFEFQNRGILISTMALKDIHMAERESWLGSGVFMKMTFEQIYPSYTMYSSWYNLMPPEATDKNSSSSLAKALPDAVIPETPPPSNSDESDPSSSESRRDP
ncbi:hypothetical protein Q4E93_33555 [Flavitalea sp. BT771]|uniref:hypothetical protein n=1 Tax=Flavitalea sp. BT771 TaxID=3063329 RepID=UPI0026E385A3|nr:hypothetical protein [Flavitalea sp. BT771]MDO6435589.1 hypothetical protein [Flavitalea sp. BT771]MDV6224489.1 hypothetical protein [Flavitalea sp. BT771]